MQQDGVLYLTERDVVSVLDMPAAIDALAGMLAAQGRQAVKNVPKALGTWGDGCSMHALGSVMTEGGQCGFKTWVHTPRGGGSMFSLFDAETGRLQALIEARALGMMRTAAISGVATRALAPRETRVAALIGTGPQAVTQLAALAAVQELDEVRVYSPTAEKRAAFVAKLAPRYGFALRDCASLQAAMDGAGIVTTITRATDPFITPELMQSCRHINAVGAILPAKAELEQAVVQSADLIVVDDRDNALRGSRELRERFGAEAAAWGEVSSLSERLAQGIGRPDGARLTLFKGMGMGLSDLAMATTVYQRAVERGLGIALPAQTRQNLLLD
ncbi:ornithine cyclodeaminase family protein [Alcaligenes sp. WGS1538]|uniref:ornithine cyclodeaminase family protein n=1 Tax=Alcaligenes sp. WGS1538 TaxID=3366811 RepID=UPI00372D1260